MADEKTKDTLLRESYSAAEKRLRENHSDEFNQLRAEEAKARGLDWKPRKTDKEKAQEQVNALLTQYPDLTLPPAADPSNVPITGT